VDAITPPSRTARAEAFARQSTLTKPTGALGRLEELSVWMAGVQGVCPPAPFARPAVVIFAGDHGVARTPGTSAYPPEVTAQMVMNFVTGGAAANVLARLAGATVRVVDVSVDANPGYMDASTRRSPRAGCAGRRARSIVRTR
jgi:nicotinate-nucleotide--dimethylbenzimidazole phosphoribosyltransferase